MLLKNRTIFISIIVLVIAIAFLSILLALNVFSRDTKNIDEENFYGKSLYEKTFYENSLDEAAVLEIVKMTIIEKKDLRYYEEHDPYQITYDGWSHEWYIVGALNTEEPKTGGSVYIIIDDRTGEVVSINYSL